MNAVEGELKHLRSNHRELWERIIDLENEKDIVGDVWDTRKRRSIKEIEEKMFWEEQQMTIFDYLGKET
ncbi:MAG: hypothetical protein ACLVA6_08225 [Dorea sp.]